MVVPSLRSTSSKDSEKSLYGMLVFSAEKFALVKAVDIASAVCGLKCIHIKANVNFASRFTDVSAVNGLSEKVAKIYTNLYGIAGIDGTLPDCYIQEFWIHNSTSRTAITDFFDIFNDKILSLHYLFLKRHHVQSLSCPSKESVIGKIVSSLAGCGFECGGHNRGCIIPVIPSQFRISSQNLFWQRTRTCEGMRILLSDFFNVPVKVKQFAGEFVEIDRSQQSVIGVRKHMYNSLGENCFLGSKTWDQTKGIDVEIGPLDFRTYVKFLQKQSQRDQQFSPLEKMKEIVQMYVPYGTNVKLHFCLKSNGEGSYGLPLTGTKRLHKDSFLCGAGSKMTAYFTERV
jgi:type VI secretion system ImpH/TssG family protein